LTSGDRSEDETMRKIKPELLPVIFVALIGQALD
jgi:hypothetical protein